MGPDTYEAVEKWSGEHSDWVYGRAPETKTFPKMSAFRMTGKLKSEQKNFGVASSNPAKIGDFSPEEFVKIRVWARLSSSHDAGLTT